MSSGTARWHGDDADDVFVKHRADAPPGFFAVEAAGLRWLRVPGGVAVVQPVEVTRTQLVLPRLPEVVPTPAAAEELGRRLAATHRAGAPWHGCPPEGWDGDGFIGPLHLPMQPHGDPGAWGPWFAEHRLLPYLRRAHDVGALPDGAADVLDRVLGRLAADDGVAGGPEPVARLHGDLWNGNVLWTADGCVLVDPAAHGGHRETDLAMLDLFGLAHLPTVVAAYDEAAPLAPGWQERTGLHQLHPLLVHAALFGGAYGPRAVAVAERYS